MPTFVALLRGINVGKANRVRMAEFRAMLEGLGYTDVATLLNSGNAVFQAPKGTPAKHAADIASALKSELKVEVPVVVKSAKEVAAIVDENPIRAEETEYSRVLVVFTQDSQALASLATIQSLVVPPEQFAIGTNAAYLFCAAGILESKAGEALLGKAAKATTTRNLATTLKIHALVNRGRS
ncbi:DUF1697 domain-containing protein [Verrucomicrobiota bacterium sgz303538]